MENLIVITLLASTVRPRPLYGLGNEFVFQSNGDEGLNAQLRAAASEISRFPGGTPSDYWLWSDGWINVSSDRSGCSGLPRRPTTVPQLSSYLNTTKQTTVLVLNQLQTNVSYQIQGLQAHARAGTPVKFIELGNEMYDATRPDVLAKYPAPRDYAVQMEAWTKEIKSIFPDSLVALVGLANDWDNRTREWNKQVLQNPISSQADAATIHLYAGIPASPPATPATLSSLLALAFEDFNGYRDYTAASIPEHFRLWVTEWGIFSDNKLLENTWFQGLWHVALTARLPLISRIDIILPYCAVCGDPFMPSFTSPGGSVVPPNATHTAWSRTPSGHAYALLFNASTASTHFAALSFSPNPVLDPKVPTSMTLVGSAAVTPAGAVQSIFLLNLGAHDLDLQLLAEFIAAEEESVGEEGGLGEGERVEGESKQVMKSMSWACQQGQQQQQQRGKSALNGDAAARGVSLDMYWPATAADVLRQGLQVSDLKHFSGAVSSSTLTLPAYAMAVLQCA
eukprot:m.230630 g.230630  ORF g.230630 m.230630 type:complete len:509 (-) comp18106_c0_seq1:37-1563(-)